MCGDMVSFIKVDRLVVAKYEEILKKHDEAGMDEANGLDRQLAKDANSKMDHLVDLHKNHFMCHYSPEKERYMQRLLVEYQVIMSSIEVRLQYYSMLLGIDVDFDQFSRSVHGEDDTTSAQA